MKNNFFSNLCNENLLICSQKVSLSFSMLNYLIGKTLCKTLKSMKINISCLDNI